MMTLKLWSVFRIQRKLMPQKVFSPHGWPDPFERTVAPVTLPRTVCQAPRSEEMHTFGLEFLRPSGC
jgi:hypothetical protein